MASEVASKVVLGSHLNTESLLLKSGRWSIFSAHLIGYLPLNIVKKKLNGKQLSSFQFQLISIPTFVSLFFMCFSITTVYCFFKTQVEYKEIVLGGTTDSLAVIAFEIMQQFVTNILRISFLFKGNVILKLWSDVVALVERISKLNSSEIETFLGEIQKQLKILFIACLTCAIVVTMYLIYTIFGAIPWGSFEYENVTSVDYTTWQEACIVDLLMGINCYLHFGNALWMLFFIKVFSNVLNALRKEVQQIGQLTHAKENLSIDHGVIASSIITPVHFIKLLECGQKKATTDDLTWEYRLKDTLALYKMLESRIAEFNKVFLFPLTVEILLNSCQLLMLGFMFITTVGYDTYPLLYMLPMYTPILSTMISIYSLCTESSLLLENSKEFLAELEILPIHNATKETRTKIQMFINRTSSYPPTISTGFVTLNKALLTTVLSSITTYLVVLVQFKGADHKIRQGNIQ